MRDVSTRWAFAVDRTHGGAEPIRIFRNFCGDAGRDGRGWRKMKCVNRKPTLLATLFLDLFVAV
jgi:hypothetical protein